MTTGISTRVSRCARPNAIDNAIQINSKTNAHIGAVIENRIPLLTMTPIRKRLTVLRRRCRACFRSQYSLSRTPAHRGTTTMRHGFTTMRRFTGAPPPRDLEHFVKRYSAVRARWRSSIPTLSESSTRDPGGRNQSAQWSPLSNWFVHRETKNVDRLFEGANRKSHLPTTHSDL